MNVYKQKTNKIIHESGWAISKKCGNKVYKIFLHDSYPKIRKEVLLLQLSLEKEVNLLYDISNEHWVCESDHMELRPIICNIGLSDFTAQLQAKFSTWKNDSRYRASISDEWSARVTSWYCMLLQQYIPDSDKLIAWL